MTFEQLLSNDNLVDEGMYIGNHTVIKSFKVISKNGSKLGFEAKDEYISVTINDKERCFTKQYELLFMVIDNTATFFVQDYNGIRVDLFVIPITEISSIEGMVIYKQREYYIKQ